MMHHVVFASLLLAVLPGERAVFDASAYVDEGRDCLVRPYGGHADVMCDLAPAVQAAIDACEPTIGTWLGNGQARCKISIPNGTWYWSAPVTACKIVDLDFHGSMVRTAPGVGLVRFLGFGACAAAGRETAGPGSLRDVFAQPFTATPTTARAYGVELSAPASLERVHLLGFTQGVRVHAVAVPPSGLLVDKSNANGWRMERVVVQSSLHAGIWVDGPDVNVGVATRIGATSNCKQGAALAELGACADVSDGSFLGCSWVGLSSGYARDAATNAVYPGIVLGDSANSRSVCLGCYIEGGYGGGIAANTTNVLGGIGAWTGSGNRLEGNRISGLESTGADGLASIKLGSLTGGGALTITPIGDSGSYPLRWKYVPASSSFVLDVANIGAAQVLRIGAKNTTPTLGLGGLLLRPNSALPNVWLNTTGYVVQRQVP